MCSTVGGAQYRGGVQYRGGYHEYRGGYLEYRGGYHDKCVGDILSTVGVFSTVGVYHEYRGWGMFSTCIMISPTVLNIPHGTQDNPPWYS